MFCYFAEGTLSGSENGIQKSVTAKIALAFWNAAVREAKSSRLPGTTSTTLAASALANLDETSRVMPRTVQSDRDRNSETTELPCEPVAPMTAVIFLVVMVLEILDGGRREKACGEYHHKRKIKSDGKGLRQVGN
jgi:hypothetical protein